MPRRGENIHKRKDGRWEGRYKKESTAFGKTQYISVYGKTYTEVKLKLRKMIQSEENTNKNHNENSFKEILYLWMDANGLKHKGATKRKYEYLIEKHIAPALGDIPVSKITSAMLNEFIERKLKNGRLDNQGALSAAYVKSMITIVVSALQYSVNEGIRLPLPTAVYKPMAEKKDLKILIPQEQKKLNAYILNHINNTKLGVFISINSGLRIGEICALKWENIDLENKTIKVRATIARVKQETGSGTKLIVDRPKTTASIRNIPINSLLLPVLTECKKVALSDYVISTSNSFVSPRTYEYRYHQILQQCGIEPIQKYQFDAILILKKRPLYSYLISHPDRYLCVCEDDSVAYFNIII